MLPLVLVSAGVSGIVSFIAHPTSQLFVLSRSETISSIRFSPGAEVTVRLWSKPYRSGARDTIDIRGSVSDLDKLTFWDYLLYKDWNDRADEIAIIMS